MWTTNFCDGLRRWPPWRCALGGVLTFGPFLGDRAIPNRIKVGLLMVLTALLVPVVPLRPMLVGPVDWVRMVLGEWLVGLLMGLSLSSGL